MTFDSIMYHHTNESLVSIIRGLAINETDDIVSVLGSGDQAFAMLEFANSVLALDINELQAGYASNRAEALAEGDIERFFARRWYNDQDFRNSNKYFSKGSIISTILPVKSRTEKIRAKLGRLEIKHAMNFLDEVREGRFSKAYLSNMLGWPGGGFEKREDRREFIRKLAPRLRSPGLIYIADAEQNWCFGDVHEIEPDIERTKAANSCNRKEYWDPAVYRRKA